MAMMKSSNTEWLGDIPAEWDVAQIGNYYELRNEKVSDYDFEPLSVTMKGIVPQLATAAKSDDHSNRKLVKKGDFVINSRSDRRGSCGISPLDGSVSLINTVMEPRGEMNPQYYNWLFHTEQFADEFYKWGHGIVDDLWTTRWQEMKKILIVAPSPDEQQAIADYLDETCSKIDEIIAEAKASIDEYKELKQSVIFEAVTKGLDKNVEMKQCSVNWLDEIPSTWESIRLKYLLTEINNRSETGTEQPLSVSQVMGVVPSYMIAVANPTASYVGQKIVEPNDIVFNKLKAHLGVFFMSKYHGLVSPDYAVYRTNDKVIPKYLEYLFHTSACISEFKKYISGVAEGLMRLYTSDLFNIRICLPKVDEQIKIVEYVENKVELFDSLIAEKESLINDLESYKKSLIYEVVTGKRRVV